MSVEIPEYVVSQGHVNAYVLPAGVDLEALTVAEFAAGVDVTCFLPTMPEMFTTEQARGEVTRACMTETMEVLGKIKRGVADLTYTVLPQAEDTDPANKVKSIVAENASVVVAVRRGPLADVAIAADQKYHALRATVGAITPNTAGGDEFAPITDTASFGTNSGLVEGVVAAGV